MLDGDLRYCLIGSGGLTACVVHKDVEAVGRGEEGLG